MKNDKSSRDLIQKRVVAATISSEQIATAPTTATNPRAVTLMPQILTASSFDSFMALLHNLWNSNAHSLYANNTTKKAGTGHISP